MSALKLNIDEFDAIDFELIAIHTSIEDYRLAYLINKTIAVNLIKNKSEITIKNNIGETSFSQFSFDDEKKGVCWDLIQNKTEILSQKKLKGQGLFAETETQVLTKVYLLPEFKKVDFFLKVENSSEIDYSTIIVSKINSIDRISTVYCIETDKIKSKNNLIF